MSREKVTVEQRRSLNRAATGVALLTAPAAFVAARGSGYLVATAAALLSVAGFRAAVDHLWKRLIDPPDLFGTTDDAALAEDALARRRMYFWRGKFRLAGAYATYVAAATLFGSQPWTHYAAAPAHWWQHVPWTTLLTLPLLFLVNFGILFGPLMMMGVSQMRGLEPGDADFGVRLDDVRGQAEAKDEIRKIITLWQSGEKFVASGGKRERGVLFLGAPGTGKTMLAKAIATGFNCPIIVMPGSGFAQTFIGMDAVVVRFLARKARKLAAKWGGSCIVFIDEIDAVGMRRAALAGGAYRQNQIPGGMFGGGMGGMALQSLLVVMDGIDNPPFLRRLLTNKLNLWLDALYVVPQRAGRLPLRLPKARPTGNQIYFIGATNVALEALDPALTRAGRMGRHIHFRTPTKRDRLDVFDLYLGRVEHDPALDAEPAREELARITNGYSPAEIEQACSIALTYAHHDGRTGFSRADLLEAMVTLEAGTALGWGYESDDEEFSTAVHEAGHAVCAYLHQKDVVPVRLSILKRGATGGHLQSVETVERFARFRGELYGRLVCTLGAYAAEYVFYGENTQGVGGDLQQASYLAGRMVGSWGMPPVYAADALAKRYQRIGEALVAAALPSDVQLSRTKSRDEAVILGQAFVTAYSTVLHNRGAVEKICAALVREKEIYGDDLTRLLETAGLEAPDSEAWPEL